MGVEPRPLAYPALLFLWEDGRERAGGEAGVDSGTALRGDLDNQQAFVGCNFAVVDENQYLPTA